MAPTKDDSLCRVCADIDFVEYFRRPVNSCVDLRGFVGATPNAIKLGSFRAIYARSRYCVFCELVVWAICTKQRKYLSIPEIHMQDSYLECWVFSYCYADSDPSITDSTKAYRIGISSKVEDNADHLFRPSNHLRDIQLMAQDALRLFGSDRFYGNLVDPKKLRIDQLRKWLGLCERKHGSLCRFPKVKKLIYSSQTGPQDLLVIDVRQSCICYLPKGSRYVALSYCWPVGQNNFLLRKANRDGLFSPGSITRRSHELSPVIQDAIHFVQEFGEDYLWIDALCIVQDDENHKQFQMSQMDKVYATAVVTLVSAKTTMSPSDASQGLPSYCEDEQSRKQITTTVRGLRLSVPFESIYSLLDSCRWSTRGWTYHECLLSGRVLFFTDQQVYFQCSCAVYCEDSAGEDASLTLRLTPASNLWNPGSLNSSNDDSRRFGALHLKLQNERQQDFCWQYADQLVEYMARNLSNTSDILNAFQGVQNVLQDVMKTKFWYGIPEMYIDYCLLWTAKRLRKQQNKSLKDTPSRIETFPSWSWAGWNWHVELSGYFGGGGVRCEVPWMLINQKGEIILLQSNDIPGKPGFPQEHNTDVSMFNSAHENLHLDISGRSEINAGGPDWASPAYLATWTQVAKFQLHGETNWMGNHSKQWPQSDNLKISNAQRDWVGSIMMDWLWVEDNLPKKQTFEFLLVSRSETCFRNPFHHFDFFDVAAFPEKPWCFLNVMLIRREGGVAERQGVGVIHEMAWVEANPIPSFIKLK